MSPRDIRVLAQGILGVAGVERRGDVRIAAADRTVRDGIHTTFAAIEIGGQVHTVTFRSPHDLADGRDAFFIAAVLPALRHGVALRTPWPVSARLRRAIPKIEEIVHCWDGVFHPISIDSPQPAGSPAPSGDRVAAFFSGGVDSFYTLLKHREEITDLILVRGFDIWGHNDVLWEPVVQHMEGAARQFGKRLIRVETDLRAFSDRYVSWDLYFGSALASVAALLGPQFRTVYIPSGHSYLLLFPNGSHPLLDPLWSTEATEIVHDGCEVTREEKILSISSDPTVLDHLRVCWENKDSQYNCGRCEKCLRTMVSLRIAGALERCRTFARPLDLGAVARVRTEDIYVRFCAERNLRAAERWGQDPALIRALRNSLSGRYYRPGWRLASTMRHLPLRAWRTAVPARWRHSARLALNRLQGGDLSSAGKAS